MSEYRISFYPRLDEDTGEKTTCFTEEYETYEHAKAALELIAYYTLFLHESSLMPDYSNYGYIEVFEDGEWIDMDNEDD